MSPQQAGGDQGHIVEHRGPCSQGRAWPRQAGEGRGLGKPPLLLATTLASLSMGAPGDCPSAERQTWPHPALSYVGFPALPFPSRSSPGPRPATPPVQESLSLVLVLLSRKPGPGSLCNHKQAFPGFASLWSRLPNLAIPCRHLLPLPFSVQPDQL